MDATPDFLSDPSQLDKYGKCYKCGAVFQLPQGKVGTDDCFCNQCGAKATVNVAKATLISQHTNMIRQQFGMPARDFSVANGRLYAYEGTSPMVSIPDGVNEICDHVFARKPIGLVEAPATLRTIGYNAFGDCPKLEAVKLPDTLESIGAMAFCKCSALRFFTVPNGVRAIEDYTFFGCTSLSSILLPATVERIGAHAFSQCLSLQMVALPPSVTSVAPDAFDPTTRVVGDPR